MTHFQEIFLDDDVARAIVKVEQWGYPREVRHSEQLGAYWFYWGDSALFWYAWDGLNMPGKVVDPVLNVHVCFDPKIQGKRYTRRFITGMEVIAECLGARYLQACDTVESGKVDEYLKRMGWRSVGDDGWRRLDLHDRRK